MLQIAVWLPGIDDRVFRDYTASDWMIMGSILAISRY